jgi:tryptophan synthase alpha chain
MTCGEEPRWFRLPVRRQFAKLAFPPPGFIIARLMTAPLTHTRLTLADTFAQLRARQQIAMMPFIAAGYPDIETTIATIPALEAAGANLIEIGFPFSDPIADGPVIQEAFVKALAKKIRVADVFAAVAQARSKCAMPFVAMLSYSVVFRYGLERFVKDAKAAGFDGLILPDLPPPEAQKVCALINAGGLETILLVAPTTSEPRRKEIARLSTGFVYYLSISGITGERAALPADLEANIRKLKSVCDRPVCVGFGINKPEHVQQLSGVADGAIVGSAFVRRMTEHAADGADGIARACAAYCRELLTKVR